MFSTEMDGNHPERANKGYRATGLGKRRNARQSPVPILNLGAGATESFYSILMDFEVLVKLMVELNGGVRTWLPDSIPVLRTLSFILGPLFAQSFLLAPTFPTSFLLLYF